MISSQHSRHGRTLLMSTENKGCGTCDVEIASWWKNSEASPESATVLPPIASQPPVESHTTRFCWDSGALFVGFTVQLRVARTWVLESLHLKQMWRFYAIRSERQQMNLANLWQSTDDAFLHFVSSPGLLSIFSDKQILLNLHVIKHGNGIYPLVI